MARFWRPRQQLLGLLAAGAASATAWSHAGCEGSQERKPLRWWTALASPAAADEEQRDTSQPLRWWVALGSATPETGPQKLRWWQALRRSPLYDFSSENSDTPSGLEDVNEEPEPEEAEQPADIDVELIVESGKSQPIETAAILQKEEGSSDESSENDTDHAAAPQKSSDNPTFVEDEAKKESAEGGERPSVDEQEQTTSELRGTDNQGAKLYTYKDVAEHNTEERGVWVTYKDGVYDVTEFLDLHPGGKDKLMLAAGKPVEPYWAIYRQHEEGTCDIITDILEPMRIGTLEDYDESVSRGGTSGVDPFVQDPVRDPSLIFYTYKPCNAETPLEYLGDSYITPAELYYVRHHAPVPLVEEKDYKLAVRGTGVGENEDDVRYYTLEQLREKFTKREVTVTLQCGGNRRAGLNKVKKTNGTPWLQGAIGTARWGGVWLSDILADAGYQHDENARASGDKNFANHIEFRGMDDVVVSIPVEKALNPFGDVLIAYEMNGEAVPREHGYPVRAVVPGYVGVRSTKWLQEIRTSGSEAEGSWQQGIAYKVMPSSVEEGEIFDHESTPSMQEMPVQSIIANVENKTGSSEEPTLEVKGVAWSGGGRGIVRVELSTDGGKNWQLATLGEGKDQNPHRAWAWTMWSAVVKPSEDNQAKGEVEVCCRATDTAYSTQPANAEELWNYRGLNNHSWHRVMVNLRNTEDEESTQEPASA